MPQFTLKALISSFAFACTGLACMRYCYVLALRGIRGFEAWGWIILGLAGGASLGAAVGGLFNHKVKWTLIAAGILAALALFLPAAAIRR